MGDMQMIRTADWKLVVYAGEPGELYNLREDIQEFHNRIHDPSCADVAGQLHQRLKAWEKQNAPQAS